MARPTTITDERLLAAAREVFLERGILATTAEVARRAGVSEGSIFRRFPTKFDLFRAAMLAEEGDPAFLTDLPGRAGTGELAAQLNEIGVSLIHYFRKVAPLMMMRWSNPETAACAGGTPSPMHRRLGFVAAYFEAEMASGRMRRLDAQLAARVFAGSVQHFVFSEILHGAPDPIGPERYVAGLVDLLLRGASPLASEVS
jgi:AcrR family transcriptional regulator